jgi:hypothetical protein
VRHLWYSLSDDCQAASARLLSARQPVRLAALPCPAHAAQPLCAAHLLFFLFQHTPLKREVSALLVLWATALVPGSMEATALMEGRVPRPVGTSSGPSDPGGPGGGGSPSDLCLLLDFFLPAVPPGPAAKPGPEPGLPAAAVMPAAAAAARRLCWCASAAAAAMAWWSGPRE